MVQPDMIAFACDDADGPGSAVDGFLRRMAEQFAPNGSPGGRTCTATTRPALFEVAPTGSDWVAGRARQRDCALVRGVWAVEKPADFHEDGPVVGVAGGGARCAR